MAEVRVAVHTARGKGRSVFCGAHWHLLLGVPSNLTAVLAYGDSACPKRVLLSHAAPGTGSQPSLSSGPGCCVPPHHSQPPAIPWMHRAQGRDTPMLVITHAPTDCSCSHTYNFHTSTAPKEKCTQVVAGGAAQTPQGGPCPTGLCGGTGTGRGAERAQHN